MSAVETDGRVPLPMDGKVDERIGLPLAQPTPQPADAVSVTARAARAFREISQGRGKPNAGLKVAVVGGGCAGNEYTMALAEEPVPTDVVLESHGIPIYVDGHTAHMLAGAEIDFLDTMMGRGFSVRNPNAATTCGCGSSFNTSGQAAVEGSCVT